MSLVELITSPDPAAAAAPPETDLVRAYRSTVDPRLNYEQALEIAMLIVRKQGQLAAPTPA